MANAEKRQFSNAPVAHPHPYPQPQGHGSNPPPYVMQPQYGQAAPPNAVYNQYGAGPTRIVTAHPVRETGTPPDTTCSFIVSILSIFCCLGAWPFAIVAIVFNRKAKGQVDLGQYTMAKKTLKTCFIFIAITVILGIIGWVIFAIRLNAALEALDDSRSYRRG